MNANDVLERVPIHTDNDGVVRVAGTRVTLDTIVDAFDAGATAEEIAQQYSSIPSSTFTRSSRTTCGTGLRSTRT